jgi:hypothetical protein
MGIIITDTLDLDYGFTFSNTYSSFARNQITIVRMKNVFRVTGIISTWINREARLQNKKPLFSEHINVLTKTPPTGNVYELLYNEYIRKRAEAGSNVETSTE